jgi:hypothetical protein
VKLRQHGILLLVSAVGLGVLGVTAVCSRPALTEWWFILRLGSSDNAARDRAARWLKENGSARAIPALLDLTAARPGERETAFGALEALLPRASAAQEATDLPRGLISSRLAL